MTDDNTKDAVKRAVRVVLDNISAVDALRGRGDDAIAVFGAALADNAQRAARTAAGLLKAEDAELLELALTPGRCSVSVARELLDGYDSEYAGLSWPRRLALTSAAVRICDAVAPDGPVVRTRALKELAGVLAAIGKFNEAFAALDRAADAATCTLCPDYYGGIVRFARAFAYKRYDRPDKGLPLVDGLETVFRRYRDTARFLGAQHLRATLLHSIGRYDDALRAYAAIEPLMRHDAARAAIWTDMCNCFASNGDAETARRYYAKAHPILVASNMDEARLKLERAIARLDLTHDRYRATQELSRIAREFMRIQMVGEALRTRIEVVAAELSANPGADIAHDCSEIARDAAVCGMEREVTSKLIELSSLAERGELTTDDAMHLREAISSDLRTPTN